MRFRSNLAFNVGDVGRSEGPKGFTKEAVTALKALRIAVMGTPVTVNAHDSLILHFSAKKWLAEELTFSGRR